MTTLSDKESRALKRKSDRNVLNEIGLIWPMLTIFIGFLTFFLQVKFNFSIFGTLGLPPTMILAIIPAGVVTLIYYYKSSKVVQLAKLDYEAIKIVERRALREKHLKALSDRASK